ncbi:hypothetical protein NIES2100_06100 [Calothrix sp. NIES-2100]|nr:hypothetical protein NIES2100_06100 [Calothrix sp. NIES-2100]
MPKQEKFTNREKLTIMKFLPIKVFSASIKRMENFRIQRLKLVASLY